jgi:ABC-2 type transport system permease protein
MNRRLRAITKKEFKQLGRDKRMLFVIFFLPVLLLVVFGYAVNFDVQNIQLAVYDQDHSTASRDVVRSLSSSSYFTVVKSLDSYGEVNKALDEGEAQAVLVIPVDFTKDLYTKRGAAKLQVLVDGIDGNTASIIQNYIIGVTQRINNNIQTEHLARAGMAVSPPINLSPVFWFNPLLETTMFLIPGLIALILIVTTVVTVSLSLVREKERGTIEQINVSSVKTIELLLGKAFPYLVLALINASLIVIASDVWFGAEIKGSYYLFTVTTLIYLFACVTFGIFISVISDSQQVAFTVAIFATLLPTTILSGFVFPIDSMPEIIQWLTNIVAAKFFINAMRAIMLRGVGLETFWEQWIYMLLYGIVFLRLATVVGNKKAKGND